MQRLYQLSQPHRNPVIVHGHPGRQRRQGQGSIPHRRISNIVVSLRNPRTRKWRSRHRRIVRQLHVETCGVSSFCRNCNLRTVRHIRLDRNGLVMSTRWRVEAGLLYYELHITSIHHLHLHRKALPRYRRHKRIRTIPKPSKRPCRLMLSRDLCAQLQSQRLHQSIVELHPLHPQLMQQVIFLLRCQPTGLHLCNQSIGSPQPIPQKRSRLLRCRNRISLHRLLHQPADLRQPLTQKGSLRSRRSRRQRSHSHQRNIHPIKKVLLRISRLHPRSIPVIRHIKLPRRRHSHPTVLRLLQPKPHPRKLQIAHPQHRTVISLSDSHIRLGTLRRPLLRHIVIKPRRSILVRRIIKHPLRRNRKKWHARIHLQRTPRQQPLRNLIRKNLRITRRRKHFLSHLTRHLMLSMPIRNATLKHSRHHQWPIQPHRPHRVVQNPITPPVFKTLFLSLREPEVHLRPPHLVDPHVPTRRQQLLRPHQPKRAVKVRRH